MSQKSKPEEIKVISIDGDGTVWRYEGIGSPFLSSWDALGFGLGFKEKWMERTRKYYDASRKDGDEQWMREDVGDLAGISVEKAKSILLPVPYAGYFKEFCEKTKGRYKRGLLTTSFDLIAEEVMREMSLDFSHHNVFGRNDGHLDGRVAGYNTPLWRKHERIADICKRFNVKEREICHIGDGENDIPVGNRVGMFIAVGANPKVPEITEQADFSFPNFRGAIKLFSRKGGRR